MHEDSFSNRGTQWKWPIKDPFHKWLPIINSFVNIKISLTSLVFELII